MENLDRAIDRIKILECPTGELENRVADILDDYRVADKNKITINRARQLDADGAAAYSAKISSNSPQSFTILAKSGLDGYVDKVIDVSIS
ncbi:hypothetical protein [Clostridium sp.]|uniref:hypothetical protein n=1 Tax=Clostridium sp. TaxID=1506 RepID=UPI003216C387